MSLEYSIASLMSRLADWSGFPKYQLERRVDIFLTPFLESFLSWALKGHAQLVVPEFPIPSVLRQRELRLGEEPPNALTANADFLFHLTREGAPQSVWLFLELKTDPLSFKDDQLLLYRRACGRTMATLIADIERVEGATTTRHEQKYAKVLGAVRSVARPGDPVELAYLTPTSTGRAESPADSERPDHFLTLGQFATLPDALVPKEHRELWPHVRDLLLQVEGMRTARRPAGPAVPGAV